MRLIIIFAINLLSNIHSLSHLLNKKTLSLFFLTFNETSHFFNVISYSFSFILFSFSIKISHFLSIHIYLLILSIFFAMFLLLNKYYHY